MTSRRGVTERKVTFSEVFAVGEYRALFSATQLSSIGDYMARAVVMVLVFVETDDMALAAAAFAISYAPWILGGPFLAALAERLRYRPVMVACDVIRAALLGLVALPGMPLPVALLLLFGVALLAPPSQAARSALLPLVLPGEKVVMGIAINQAFGQATQVAGYMAGALVAAQWNPRLAIVVTMITFLVSAVLQQVGLQDRPPAIGAGQRTTLLRETAEGFRVVFGTPALRVIAIIVFASMLFAILPEGLAIGWADALAEQSSGVRRGIYQGLIMVSNPLGMVLGGLLISRLLAPSVRRRLVPVLAVLAPMTMVPSLVNPGIVGVVAMATACGFVMAGMVPTLNGMFVQILRHGYRARAFGVMNSGMQILQGLAVLLAGLLTKVLPLHQVVGLWCTVGVFFMLVLALRWPRLEFFNRAIEETAALERQRAEESESAARPATDDATPAAIDLDAETRPPTPRSAVDEGAPGDLAGSTDPAAPADQPQPAGRRSGMD